MKGLGFRQRAILACLRSVDTPLPTWRLLQICAIDEAPVHPKIANIALTGLERRGLVRHVRHGWWAAA